MKIRFLLCLTQHNQKWTHHLLQTRVPHPVIFIRTGSVSCPSQKLGIILDSILSHHPHPNDHHALSTIKPFHLCALSLPLTVLQVRPPSSLTWIAAKPPKVVLFAPIHSSGGSDGKEFAWMQKMWVQSLGLEDPWRRGWQPTPVFFPRESHGQRNSGGYSPWGCEELDTTEQLYDDYVMMMILPQEPVIKHKLNHLSFYLTSLQLSPDSSPVIWTWLPRLFLISLASAFTSPLCFPLSSLPHFWLSSLFNTLCPL